MQQQRRNSKSSARVRFVTTAWTRSPGAPSTAPTTAFPTCSTARSCAARMRTPGSNRSTSTKALALPGVKAVLTGKDLPELPNRMEALGEIPFNPLPLRAQRPGARQGAVQRPRDGRGRRHLAAYRRGGAGPDRGRVRACCRRCINVDDAMAPGAPILHPDLRTAGVRRQADQYRLAPAIPARRPGGRLRDGRLSSSSASSTPRWSIRDTSSRTTRWRSTAPTATSPSIARPRRRSRCAR